MHKQATGPSWPHQPVMAEAVMAGLNPSPKGVWVDGTLGAGGHSALLAERIAPEGRLVGLDVDPTALDICTERSKAWGCRVNLVQAGYEDLEAVLDDLGIEEVSGVLLDLGVSSMHLDQAERGFSFRNEGPLDMRMDPSRSPSAAEWLAEATEKDIRWVLQRYGEEKRAGAVARAIVKGREKREIRTTLDLAEIVKTCFPDKLRAGNVHPATRTFQGIRIYINQELDRLERFLDFLPSRLEQGGRFAVLAYHSLEDRLIKRAFERWGGKADTVLARLPIRGEIEGTMKAVTRKAVRPTESEIEHNPRSRSARLRVAERTGRVK